MSANVISWSLFPRYLHRAKHMEPVVMEACLRIVWDDGNITLETISTEQYNAATGCEIDAMCNALDRHPRGTP